MLKIPEAYQNSKAKSKLVYDLYAKILFCNQKLPVYQVVDKIEYKKTQHFTVAFIRYFGYVPSKLIG
ncbi:MULTISPECIES: helix-turn-helix transcriptional regulator [Flavobacteriaceae]|uniref:helix-turn-helix transcriptional regulator n=1 Tax=Flavobacteriaceae TaxID=49546 RepID=UPI001492BC64|nr:MULTISPECIES: helix-turn-helix transcriptional regulator [Allomuricauda]MDC6367530.1 hypothetical protein [Muricauda sp. AC10]